MLAVVLAFLAVAFGAPLTEQQTQFLFTRFVDQYSKQYETTQFFKKYNTFKDNLNLVLAHNERSSDFKLAMNQFGDLTATEFASLQKLKPVGAAIREMAAEKTTRFSSRLADSEIDWRGKMNPVKDQGSCGSCWAFSAVGTMEGTVNIAGKGLFQLAEQQLVDCAGSAGNQGCNGGLMDSAYEYVQSNKGLCASTEYPYTAKDGSCKKTCTPVANISGFKVLAKETGAISAALVDGPVAVALAASGSAFQFYSSGIITKGCGTALDHGVIAVGQGTEGSVDYYRIRNSWGASWGEAGHVRIQRGNNQCGVELHNWNVKVSA